jgi:hypothetical protein
MSEIPLAPSSKEARGILRANWVRRQNVIAIFEAEMPSLFEDPAIEK